MAKSDMTSKYTNIVIGIVVVLALLPLAFDSIADIVLAYPQYAVIFGVVGLLLVVGLLKHAK